MVDTHTPSRADFAQNPPLFAGFTTPRLETNMIQITNGKPIKYVCGFLFDSQLDRVALIRKNRGPNNMAGKLNGIGGKMKRGESPRGAQHREFLEETGVDIPVEKWMCFHTERYWQDSGSTVYFMTAKSLDFHLVRTMEDEQVTIFGCTPEEGTYAWDLQAPEFMRSEIARPMYNLEYLIPMARSWLLSPMDRYMES